jgi:hypothetical protein
MYHSPESIIIPILVREWGALKAKFANPADPINAYLGLPEVDDIRKAYAEDQKAMQFVEGWPGVPAKMPVMVVEEREQSENEQFLGHGLDHIEDAGAQKLTERSMFSFRRTVSIEVLSKNKNTTEYYAILARLFLLSARSELDSDSNNFRKQRIQALAGIVREVPDFPEDVFGRTILFSYDHDEAIEVVRDIPTIQKFDIIKAATA